jgi:hypothetical protein
LVEEDKMSKKEKKVRDIKKKKLSQDDLDHINGGVNNKSSDWLDAIKALQNNAKQKK